MKNTSKKLENFITYSIQTKELINFCEENDEYKYHYFYNDDDKEELSLAFRAALFPYLINLQYDNIPSISDGQMKKIIILKRKIIKKNGDIFTRLRYASNNKTHEQFNINEIEENRTLIPYCEWIFTKKEEYLAEMKNNTLFDDASIKNLIIFNEENEKQLQKVKEHN